MDYWEKATEELSKELRQVVDSAGAAGNTALHANSLALYNRFIWEESGIRGPEIVRRVMDHTLDNPNLGRNIRDGWQASRTAIANAGEDFRKAVKDAADKFLQIVRENELQT